MFEVLKKGKLHNLSIQCQLDLFEKIIKPIFLYGSEIWDFSNNESIERVHLKFCKILLKLKISTPNYLIYRELGLYPMDIDIKVRIISYWTRLLTGKQSQLSFLTYKCMHNLSLSNNINFDQIEFVKGVFDNCGYTYVWKTQTFITDIWLKQVIKVRLQDQFRQLWLSTLYNSPKGLNYKIFKDTLEFENYFNILEDKDLTALCRFRTTNHRLPIECGRWCNVSREDRICTLCLKNEIGDEFHYLFSCDNFNNQRKLYIKEKLRNRPNTLKFKEIMTSKNKYDLQKLCRFVAIINKGDSPILIIQV